MSNFLGNLQISKDKDGNKIFVRRCNNNLCKIDAYRDCLMREISQGKKLSHPNLLEYLGLYKDSSSEFVAFKYIPSIPLHKALLDSSYHITDKKQTVFIMNQLLDVVTYLHSNGILHLNINPDTIYVRKGKNTIYLINEQSTYMLADISYATFHGHYSDPNLFNEDSQPDERCDIYSIGKVMEFMYSYSNLTTWIRHIVKKATNPDLSKRYKSIEELRKDYNKAPIFDGLVTATKVAAVVALLFLGYLGLKDDPGVKENYQFREETKRMQQVSAAMHEKENHALIDTIPIDTALIRRSLHDETTDSLFKEEFKIEALYAINKIYNKEMMNTSPDKFQKISQEEFSRLDSIQKTLAVKYNMDFIYSTKLSSEVISSLTEKRMKTLHK